MGFPPCRNAMAMAVVFRQSFSFLLSPFSFLLSPFSFLLSPFSFLLSPFSFLPKVGFVFVFCFLLVY